MCRRTCSASRPAFPDGDVVAVGDTDYKFGIESVSKVPGDPA